MDDVTPRFPLVEAAFPFLVPQRRIDAAAGGKLPVTGSQNATEERDGQNTVKRSKQARSSGI